MEKNDLDNDIKIDINEFLKISQFSLKQEEKKEQRLILQSGHLLTSFSIVSVMLLAIIPILLDNIWHTEISSKCVFVFLVVTLLFLIISFFMYNSYLLEG